MANCWPWVENQFAQNFVASIQHKGESDDSALDSGTSQAVDIRVPKMLNEPYDDDVKMLISILENTNYLMHRIEQKTGLEFAHYRVKVDGFEHAGDLGDRPYEVQETSDGVYQFGENIAEYRFTSFDNQNIKEMIEQVKRTKNCLRQGNQERKEYLKACQLAWDHAAHLDPEIKIHYGFARIKVTLPIPLAVKYGIHFHMPALSTVYSRFDDRRDQVILSIRWEQHCDVVLDDLAYILSWKIQQYREEKQVKAQYIELMNHCGRFGYWEQRTLKSSG